MLERGAVRLGEQEVLLALRSWPVERQRDLGRRVALAAQREILILPPPSGWTCQPCACSAAWSAAGSPE